MTIRHLKLAIAAALLFSAIMSAAAEGESWKGKHVVATMRDKDINLRDAVDEKQQFPLNSRMPVVILADRGDRLLISNGKRLGWAAKTDFILDRDAATYFDRRVRSNPRDAFALLMRGICLIEKGDLKNALQDFSECIRLDPSDSSAFLIRGATWLRLKDFDKAIKDYDEAIRIEPMDALAFDHRGFTWSQKKEYEKALKDFDEAIRLDPKLVNAYDSRGVIWNGMKRYDEAIRDFDEAIRLDPKYIGAFNNRGFAWSNKKIYDKAIKDYDEAIRLDPRQDYPLGNLAWLLATCPESKFRNGKRALELATKACELTRWKAANHIDTLAAAYAESGTFEQAVRRETQAIELEDSYGNKRDDYRQRLRLYENQQPYRH
jgi:tetratricopeptide (TPR) repeat protein